MSIRRQRFAWVFLFASVAAAVAAAMPGCSSKSSGVGLAAGCSLNSDCDSPLVCIFSLCHQQCASSRDCPMGEACVAENGGGVCQLASEANCNPNGTACEGNLVCGQDDKCRAPCTSVSNCLAGQQCTNMVCYDPGELDGSASSSSGGGSGSGSGGGSGSSSGSGGSSGGDGGDGGSSPACPTPETQFGGVAQGDTNADFVSGLGIRTATQMIIFDGYAGPDPVGDAGTVNYIYAQAFDPVMGNSQGPAAPLFLAQAGSYFAPYAAAVAPTGEIALLYTADGPGLWVAFLTNGADAGTAGLQVTKTFQLDPSPDSQPQAIWSVASKAFVFSWKYGGGYVKVAKYLPNGNAAGGSTDPVPTDQTNDGINGSDNQGIVAASNDLFGVAYIGVDSNDPHFTVLDPQGNQVGNTFVASSLGDGWITAGGTNAGFLLFTDVPGGGTAELLVPVLGDGGVPATMTPDGGDAGLSGFQFPGTKEAVYARAVNDDVGGLGGVGLAILYQDSVQFAYVSADGVTHVGPSSLVSHTYSSSGIGDYIHVNNAGGSFGVSLYSAAAKSTQVMASGCAP